jgi:hypothetical protein
MLIAGVEVCIGISFGSLKADGNQNGLGGWEFWPFALTRDFLCLHWMIDYLWYSFWLVHNGPSRRDNGKGEY